MKTFNLFHIYILSFILSSCASGEPKKISAPHASETKCIGSDQANMGIIYLHGMDSFNPSQQELENRQKLGRIADKLNLKIALPRAEGLCPTNANQICWGWDFLNSDLSNIVKKIDGAANVCKLPPKNIIILGFSNGGYAVDRLFEQCKLAAYRGVVSSSASIFKNSLNTDLSKCGFIKLLAGEQDHYNFDPSHNYLNQLKLNKANAEEVNFTGGHELSEDALFKMLQGLK